MKKAYALFLVVLTIVVAGLLFGADEITLTGILKVDNGDFKLTRSVSNQKVTQVGRSIDYHIQNIQTGAVPEQITIIADVATNGYTWMRNITTNTDRFIDIGGVGATTNLIATIRLYASEFGIIRLHPTNTIWGLSTGGTVDLEIWINED